MSLEKCLDGRVQAGLISRDKADMMLALVGDLERQYRTEMGPNLAGAAAVEEAVKIMREAATAHKRRTALQIMAQTLVVDDATSHPNGVIAGAMATLVRDMWGKATYSNVETRREVIQGRLFSMFAAGIDAYRSKAAGLRQDVLGVRNLVRELFGEGSNDPTAKSAAKGFSEAADYAAKRYIQAGGELAEREDWRLPQIHDDRRIKEAGFEQWRDTIMPLLDDRTWTRLEGLRRELIGQRGEVDKVLAQAAAQRETLRGNARGTQGEFEQAQSRKTTAERRARELQRQLGEVERELEAQRARAMDAMLSSRERRMDAVGEAADEAEGLLPTAEDARSAARRGDRQAQRDRTRAGEADTAVTRLETRRSELQRQLDDQRAKAAEAEEAARGKGGQWQAYEEDLRLVEQQMRDLQANRRVIAQRIDSEPGEISPAHREEVLRYIFDQMTSPVPRSLLPGTMSVAKHNARRFFVFKDADSWLSYNDAFGSGRGGIYDLLVGHMEAMARDIALVENLGPKPNATIRALQELAYQTEGDLKWWQRMNPVRTVESAAAIGRTYDVVSGRASGVEGELLAGIAGGVRSWLTAAKLGSAVITAVPSDAVTAAWAAKANGIPAVKLMATAMKQMNPASDADRQLALRMGIVASAVSDQALGTKRFQDEIVGRGLPARIASFVIRAQGLAAWTNGLKHAFAMEMMGYVADNVGKPLGEVSKPLRRMMQRYGITAAEWDVIRAAPLLEAEGARFFDPAAVSDRRIGEKLMEAIIQERQFAVLEPDARVRQLTTAGLKRGTFWGEVARSAWMFKSFAVTMATTHMMRAATQSTALGKIGYAAGLGALLTIAGAMAIQAKQMLAGKDPRDMSTKEFWGAAMLQGGALGYFGDFLSSAVARDGREFGSALSGPALGLVGSDIPRLISPRIRELYEGEPSRFGAELARFTRFNLPGGNLWYSRLALERAVMDQVQSLVDPDYRRSFARMERRARKDYGQRFWWRPGDVSPDRAPDLGAALPR